jgi:hypothetical protein
MTVLAADPGATPAEKKSAALLADTIERKDATRRADAVSYLKARNWSEPVALGIAAHLDLSPDYPEGLNVAGWTGKMRDMMLDWCSAGDRNPTYLTSQLSYICDQLQGTFSQSIPLLNAKTKEQAADLVAPYFKLSKGSE